MRHKALRSALVIGCAAALGASGLGAAGQLSRADAVSLKQKVASITAFNERPARRQNRTTVTEKELNAYLAYEAPGTLPAGVIEPAISIMGTGRISARAVVDLDAVRRQKAARGVLDPLNYATGRLPVAATGVLKTGNGIARFDLESATISSVPIPKLFLQEIVSYYSRTPQNPSGIGLDDAFPLPSGIREIQVEAGRAVILQ